MDLEGAFGPAPGLLLTSVVAAPALAVHTPNARRPSAIEHHSQDAGLARTGPRRHLAYLGSQVKGGAGVLLLSGWRLELRSSVGLLFNGKFKT